MLHSFFPFLVNLIIGIIGIGIIVFLHELGHFFAAKIFQIDVETLSFGMGPVLFSHHGKKTVYQLSLFPFGGYCRIKGSIELTKALKEKAHRFNHTEKGSFFGTTPPVRFLIFLSGPLASFIIAVILFTIVYLIPTQTISNPARILKISDYPTLYPSGIEQEEIVTGDLIIEADDLEIEDYEQFAEYLKSNQGKSVKVKLSRDGNIIIAGLYPQLYEDHYSFGIANYQEPIIGRSNNEKLKKGDLIISVNGNAISNTNDFYHLAVENEILKLKVKRNSEIKLLEIKGGVNFDFSWNSGYKKQDPLSLLSALRTGFDKSINISKTTISALKSVIKPKTDNSEIRNTITGPMKAAQTIGMITMLGAKTGILTGIRALLYLLAIVSISLFIANLLPIPSFDGGQMLINLYAMIIKKDLSPRGFVVLQISGIICTIIILSFMYGMDVLLLLKR